LDIALRTAYFAVTLEAAAQREFCELTFRQLVADQHRLPPLWLNTALERIKNISRDSPELSTIADGILGKMLRTARLAEVIRLSEAEISIMLEHYVPSAQFERASQVLQTQRMLILFGLAGTTERPTAIALLRRMAAEALILLPPTTSLDDLAIYDYRPGCGYAIIDWQNGLARTIRDAFWNSICKRVGAADAHMVITVADPSDMIPYFRWNPPPRLT